MKKAFVLLVMIFTMAVSPMLSVQAYEGTAVVQINKENANAPMAEKPRSQL